MQNTLFSMALQRLANIGMAVAHEPAQQKP
jgi:hypothetical protein